MTRLCLLAITVFAVGPGVGCAQRGTVYLVPRVRKDFQPGEPPVAQVPVTEACHWEEDGSLKIALAYRATSWLGESFDTEWLMSIVLDGPPAGSERVYPNLGIRSVRVAQSSGADHRRGRSVQGVVVLENRGGGRYAGRFHVLLQQQQFTVLNGWAPPIHRAPFFIATGEFESVENAEEGRAILARTEEDNFERPPPGTSPVRPLHVIPLRPATRPGG